MEKFILTEKACDKRLQIQTTGLREWGQNNKAYNRYEATPYTALKKLFSEYRLSETDHLVDYGSGRGRVAFYVHNEFNIPVTGVEANDKTIAEAFKNRESYLRRRGYLKAPITFELALAEQYKVNDEATCFFFFNPFSVHIFKKVIHRMLQSVERNERTIELIMYYPLSEFQIYLQTHTAFEMIHKILTPGEHGEYGKFIIYRLEKAEQPHYIG